MPSSSRHHNEWLSLIEVSGPFLSVPVQNAAERQRARYEEGATLPEIYAEQVRAGERIG